MKKNFKRLLCLVLVVSLVCSLGVTAFAANSSLTTYTDVDEITYAEAVDVLTGVGILEGSNGTFKPSDNMTRAEASKIIAYLALGADTASSLSATSAPFDDVPLSHWASGYIAYCASAGIVNGDGTGNFNPEDNVTAYQFGKMLLCTVGYGQKDEFIGENWAINTAAMAGALGVYADKEGALSGNTAITRDEMALYTFNTLTNIAQVNYNETLAEYYVGTTGALSSVGTTVRDEYKYETYIEEREYASPYEYTIGYQSYDLVKAGSEAENDAFGRPCYTWKADGAEVSDSYVDGNPDYTFSNFVESQTIYSEIGKTIADYTFRVYEDNDEYTVRTDIAVKNSDSKIVKRGSTLELYVDDSNKSVKAVLINTYLAQVTDVDTSGNEVELTLKAYDIQGNSETELTIDSSIASNVAAFEEDDYVLITWSEAEPDVAQSITAATVVEGTPTAYSANASITVDGTKYSYSYTFSSDTNNDNVNGGFGYQALRDMEGDYDVTVIVYADQFGNIIGFEEADETNSTTVASKKYLYVKGVSTDYYDGFDDAEVKVKATFTDGTTDTIYLKVTDAGKTSAKVTIKDLGDYSLAPSTNSSGVTAAADAAAIEDALVDSVFSYTVNSSGYYTLTALNSSTANQYTKVTVDDKSAVAFNGTTLYANSSTKLVLVDDQKVYTGYANFPSETWDAGDNGVDAILALTSSSSNRLTYIYVFGDSVSSTEDLIYAMYTGSGDVTVSDGSETAQFWVNGSKVTYEFDEGDIDSSWSKFQAGWIEVGSDGLATFTPFTKQGVQFESDDYYIYFGEVITKNGDTIEVDGNGDGIKDYTFSLAEDYESTRIKAGGSAGNGSPAVDDVVWIFTENPVDSYGTSEAIATIAIDDENSNADTLLNTVYNTILELNVSTGTDDSSDDTADDTTGGTGDTTDTTDTTGGTTDTATDDTTE